MRCFSFRTIFDNTPFLITTRVETESWVAAFTYVSDQVGDAYSAGNTCSRSLHRYTTKNYHVPWGYHSSYFRMERLGKTSRYETSVGTRV